MSEQREIVAKNKKARHEYFLEDEWTAGIALLGTEIKSIRAHKARITEGYCTFIDDDFFILNMSIDPYSNGGYVNHEVRRVRKLLLKGHELKKLKRKLRDVGNTCVPTVLFISENGYAKVEIALATGKKLHDKRQDLKTKEATRSMDRSSSGRY